MFRKIMSLMLTSCICIATASCSFLAGSKTKIPELARITEYTEDDEGTVEATLFSFDGEDFIRYNSNIKYKDRDQYLKDIERLKKLVKKTVSCKGSPAPDFSPDKIKYPIYSFIVVPRKIGEKTDPGENIVWTNGYLITDSGDAYKSDIDFSSVMGTEDLFKEEKYEVVNVLKTSCFRPLAMANGKWNTDYLYPVESEDRKRAPDVKGKVTNRYQKDGFDWISIEFENRGDKEWNFSDSYSMDIKVDDQLYSVPRDSCRNPGTIGVMSYRNLAMKKSTTTKDYCLTPYGDLVPGDYVISIPAVCGQEDCVILVGYTINK